jgi:hypothetical protein
MTAVIIKALLIDPDAHGCGEDGVQLVEIPADRDTQPEPKRSPHWWQWTSRTHE